ncbi:hypothetical protein LL254_05340 [Marinobacter nauticus]|uniref:hypothetical protein n=1 Tax=Marinobacter nauticus TaxID=2743 RepID=UPI001D189EC7|nr:hypothetical protein [Marinobacter nauticus]MCC4270124.1 hypothetical protein [Marinobacter nauticus]
MRIPFPKLGKGACTTTLKAERNFALGAHIAGALNHGQQALYLFDKVAVNLCGYVNIGC